MSANTSERDHVRRHTAPEITRRIDREIENSIRFHASQPPGLITARIRELDAEWDIERVLQTNAATLALTGAIVGLTVNRKALVLTCGVLGFLLQHALSGWCPPLPLLRRLGFRTRKEIDRERYALKALRGDFRDVPSIEAKPAAESSLLAGNVLAAVNA